MTIEIMVGRRRALSRLCLGAWGLLIGVASLIPPVPGPVRTFLFHGADRVGHFAAYAVFCLLLIWNMPGTRWRTRLLVAAVLPILFGILMELIQPLTGRHFDFTDMGANALGVLAALLGAALASRVAPKREATGAQ
jgi:VanZ family protein